MRSIAALLLCIALYGCGGGEEIHSIRVSGEVAEPAFAGQTVDYQIIAVFDSGFGSASGCTGSSSAKQATAFRELKLGEDGVFQVEVSPGEMWGVPLPDCRIERVDFGDFESLRLRAVMDATAEVCENFCSGVPDGCQDQCNQPGRKLISDQRFNQDELGSRATHDGGILQLETRLRFDEAGPIPGNSSKPDLIVNRESLSDSVTLSQEMIAADSCALNEGCVRGPGERRLLRFDMEVMNIGGADLFFGEPEGPLFDFDSCHDHHHLHGFVRYELFRERELVVAGDKDGFCIMDWLRWSGQPQPRYDCDLQGLSAGWSDVYDRSLDCQWLDVTDLPSGKYRLRVTVNPEGLYEETETSNNSVEIDVTL